MQSRQLAKVLDPFYLNQKLTAVVSSDLRSVNLSCMLCTCSEPNLPIGADGFSSWETRLGVQGDLLHQPRLQSRSEPEWSQCTDFF